MRAYVLLDHAERAVVDRDGRANHGDARALAIVDMDASIVDGDRCPGRAPERDAAGWSRRIADRDAVLQLGLENNIWVARRACQSERRHIGGCAPPSAGPDRTVRIAALELHPNAGADLRHHERAHLFA